VGIAGFQILESEYIRLRVFVGRMAKLALGAVSGILLGCGEHLTETIWENADFGRKCEFFDPPAD
jgi:hypothetical protein